MFDDTIYVANGVYEEQVVMIPGLSLIGAGMDSCIVDTRNFAAAGFSAIEVHDSCLIKGFHLIISSTDIGYGIVGFVANGLIAQNKVSQGTQGILLWNRIYKHTKTFALTIDLEFLLLIQIH